jgi:hypothetical protein
LQDEAGNCSIRRIAHDPEMCCHQAVTKIANARTLVSELDREAHRQHLWDEGCEVLP